ncbi:MAG: hypothetical protein ACXABI_10695 [Candidatus Hodarchaeales archaeon]
MKSINFEEIKEILLTETDLTPYLTSGENAKKGLLLFWALDSLSGKTTNQNFMNNVKTLKEIQRKVCYEDGLSTSLKMYSHEFILGVLEFTSRSIEANIEKYTQYNIVVRKLESWKELGFPNEDFEKLYNEAIQSVLEIRDWQKTKLEEYFPIIQQLINSSRYTKSEKQVLKFLRKRSLTDKAVFFLLAAVVRTNPLLHFKIMDVCEEKNISFSILREKLDQVMILLGKETVDPKVKSYIQLFQN